MNSNSMMRRAPLLAALAATAWAVSPALQAQGYPAKPVRVIVA